MNDVFKLDPCVNDVYKLVPCMNDVYKFSALYEWCA